MRDQGVKLRSCTDTEVLIQGIRIKGLDFLKEIDGCWAFAYLNNTENKLIISRDLLGEKQIFYYKDANEFIFSSESSSLLEIIGKNLEVDIVELLTSIRFFSSSNENTIINKIKKFKPGQTLIFDLAKNVLIKEFYPVKLDPHKWIDYFKVPSDESVIKLI